ncbi:MAG: hypothetical protein QM770_03495 [Tepidisphaeraceae bacterium]
MLHTRWLGLAVFAAGAFAAGPAHASVWFDFIDVGTPTDGVQVMTGWHGIVVRRHSDQGPISRIDGSFCGSIAQRWIDPTGSGIANQALVLRDPGPLPARNAVPSEWNFDSHLLGSPSDFSETDSIREYEFQYPSSDRTGLQSTDSILYRATWAAPLFRETALDFELELYGGGHVDGRLFYTSAKQAESIDVAYLVTDSSIGVQGSIHTPGHADGVSGTYTVPEPELVSLVGLATSLLLHRPRQ